MQLEQLNSDLTVCKITSVASVDFSKPFTFVSVTDDEISLVCETAYLPENTTEIETGWQGLKISGVLDFSLIGIIAKISSLLADQQVSLFVVSTFNTDYILLKNENYQKALEVLRSNDYAII